MFLYLLSWFSTLLHILFCTLSLAAGLYYVAEVVEEYTHTAAKVIKYMIYGTSVIMLGLLLIEGMPLYLIGTLLLTNIDHYFLLNEFPYISLSSLSFLIGAVMVLVNHYLAFSYFATVYYPFSEILAYFTLCLWLVPFSFFVSLSINEYTLPTMQLNNPNLANPVDNVFRRPKRSGVLGLFDYFTEKKDRIKEELFGRNKMF